MAAPDRPLNALVTRSIPATVVGAALLMSGALAFGGRLDLAVFPLVAGVAAFISYICAIRDEGALAALVGIVGAAAASGGFLVLGAEPTFMAAAKLTLLTAVVAGVHVLNTRRSMGVLLFAIAMQVTGNLRAVEGSITAFDIGISVAEIGPILVAFIVTSIFNGTLRKRGKKLKERLRVNDELVVHLESANRELDTFAYIASHDLRAPLRGIASLSEFICEDLEDVDGVSDEVRDMLELLRRRVQRLDDLLMSLLEYTRIGRASMKNEKVDVRELLDAVIDLLGIPEGFEVSIEGDLPTLVTPRPALERVLVHLIGNAVKHHDRADGHITVSYEETKAHAVFTITDDGPGIPVHLHDKVFEIMATLKRRDELEGAGMGLALIRKIVETVGGELLLHSEGRGCRFEFRWPLEWNHEAA